LTSPSTGTLNTVEELIEKRKSDIQNHKHKETHKPSMGSPCSAYNIFLFQLDSPQGKTVDMKEGHNISDML
jgi:hypothetical protein